LSDELEERKGGLKPGGEQKSASRREMLESEGEAASRLRLVFLRSETEFGSDGESRSPPMLVTKEGRA